MPSTVPHHEQAHRASFAEVPLRDCSIKRTLDVVGERWSLLVIREAFYGARRFEQFLAKVGCARSLLTERLATLATLMFSAHRAAESEVMAALAAAGTADVAGSHA